MKKLILVAGIAFFVFGCKKPDWIPITEIKPTEVNKYPINRVYYEDSISKPYYKQNYTFKNGNLTQARNISLDPMGVETKGNLWNFDYDINGNMKTVTAHESDSSIVSIFSFSYVNGKILQIVRNFYTGPTYGDSIKFVYNQNNELIYLVAKSFGNNPSPHRDSVLISKTVTMNGYEFNLRPFQFDYTTNSNPLDTRTDQIIIDNVNHIGTYNIRGGSVVMKTSKIRWVLEQLRYFNTSSGSTDPSQSTGGYVNLIYTIRPEMNVFAEVGLHEYAPSNSSFNFDNEIVTDAYGRLTKVTYFQTSDGIRSLSNIQKYNY